MGLPNQWIQRFRSLFISDHNTYTPELKNNDTYNNAIVIDKGRQHLYSYDGNGKLLFHTPVSTGSNMGSKQKSGDSKTPVGKFNISRFENNRDPKVFGSKEFWRLRGTGFEGIGIHGDAGHPEMLGLPASHGCIRMHRDSIPSFQTKVKPFNGQQVYILDELGNY